MQTVSFWTDPIGWLFFKKEPSTPASVPSAQTDHQNLISPINTTAVIGYLIVGGIAFYFGKRILGVK